MSILLDALGYLGDTFDKPGRALRGFLGGRPEELLAAVPFSDSLGLTDRANRVSGEDLTGLDDGSLLSTIANIGTEVALDPLTLAGGLMGRALGKSANRAAVARGPGFATTEDDVLRMARDFDAGPAMGRVKDTDAAWAGVTDSVPGGPLGSRRQFNPNKLDEMVRDETYSPAMEALQRDAPDWGALYDQPARLTDSLGLYNDTVAAINRNGVTDTMRGVGAHGYDEVVGNMLGYAGERSPADLSRMLSEINPKSKIIGIGNEAVAFRDPSGYVSRVEFPNPLQRGASAAGTPGRPVAEGVLPATSTTDIGNTFRVERTPFAENVGSKEVFKTRDPSTMLTKLDELDNTLAGSNLELNDRILGNVGMYNNHPVVIDPGAVRPMLDNVSMAGATDAQIADAVSKYGYSGARVTPVAAGEPGRLMNLILGGFGADDAVRRAYASGLSAPRLDRKIGAYGVASGADAGILARLLSGE